MWLGSAIAAQLLLVVTVAASTASKPAGGKVELPSDCGRFLTRFFSGSNKTEPSEYPWLVLLEYESPGGTQVLCGGVLLSNRYVLSAGHCVKAPEWTVSSVRLGEYDLTTNVDCIDEGNGETFCMPNSKSIKVDKWMTPEQYKYGQPGYDIALLRLAEEVKFDGYVKPICLPETTNIAKKFQVAGWGALSNRVKHPVKLRSSATMVDKKTCVNSYAAKGINVNDDQICLGGVKDEQICIADSGGPLMGLNSAADGSHRMSVFGVFTHYSSYCDSKGWSGIFTDVIHHRDWIVQQVQQG